MNEARAGKMSGVIREVKIFDKHYTSSSESERARCENSMKETALYPYIAKYYNAAGSFGNSKLCLQLRNASLP